MNVKVYEIGTFRNFIYSQIINQIEKENYCVLYMKVNQNLPLLIKLHIPKQLIREKKEEITV